MSIEQHHFTIRSATPPVIEVDSIAKAVYVRFKKASVVKTISQEAEHMHIAVDIDSKGEVVGIEAVGITQFTLRGLLQMACVKAPTMDYSRAKYSPTEMVGAN